jgi:hypothetical protein
MAMDIAFLASGVVGGFLPNQEEEQIRELIK